MASILVMFISCHSFLGMLSMCYFIKIFRVIIFNWVKLYSDKFFGTNLNTNAPTISYIHTHDVNQNVSQTFMKRITLKIVALRAQAWE